MGRFVFVFSLAGVAGALPLLACGGTTEDPPVGMASSDGGVADTGRLAAPLRPDASCEVIIDTPAPSPNNLHVPVGTVVSYTSNPPAWGPHFPVWAAFQAYDAPVPRSYWVHNLEHGAVVLLYNCDAPGGCPDTVAALKQVIASLPDDPLCTARGEGIRLRYVLTPDPLLDVPVAATGWGWTYKAQCVDVPTLTQFLKDRYGQGPETTCGNGQKAF